MDTDEVIKLVDGVYKNILEKFNPGARQLINAGKAYLKALHGAAAASRLFNESLLKIASNAQHGGTNDIGAALLNIVEVYKGIQDQQMNILKAFYVDLLVPLETNLEKDTKVVQFEQKKFLQNHKIRTESYSKAAATMKKQRKKKNSPQSTDKDIKNIQALEEQKNKLDAFCEQSFKNAMTQERRRYGFVLERQCSLAKHWMAYYTAGKNSIESNLENWSEIAASRETLPPHIDNVFAKRMAEKMRDDEENASITSALRKTRSVDASCLDMRSIGELANTAMCMPRAKSEFNLTSSASSPHELRVLDDNWDKRTVVKALFAYISSGENQLSFLEGDRIALVGNRAKGWQFGENLRTQMFGWFPIAYTELEHYNQKQNIYEARPPHHMNGNHNKYMADPSESTVIEENMAAHHRPSYHSESSPTRMFGDTLMFRQSKQYRRNAADPKPGPPPALPAPVPAPVVPAYKSNISQSRSFCSPVGPPMIEKRKPGPPNNYSRVVTNKQKPNREGVTSASLHSSNDSGFANEPPPQPEVDYSDEEQSNRIPIRSQRSARNYHESNGRSAQAYRSNDSASTLQKRYKNQSQNGDSSTLQRPRPNGNSGTMNRPQSMKNLGEETSDTGYHTTERKGNLIKRTKSFWRFGKSEDILEGMSMWRHRDLMSTDKDQNANEVPDKNLKNENITNDTNMAKHRNIESPDQPTEDESIYGVQPSRPTPMAMSTPQKLKQTKSAYYNGQNNNNTASELNYTDSNTDDKDYRRRPPQRYYDENANTKNLHNQHGMMNDDDKSSMDGDNDETETLTMNNNNFFDDESVEEIVMKTVKRHEILKQYDTSGTDSEPHSSSSDAYDCIVVDDHLVRKARGNRRKEEDKMEFKTFRDSMQNGGNTMEKPPTTGTMLPRTKLSKVPNPIQASSDMQSNRTSTTDRQPTPKDMNGHMQNQKMPKDRNSKTYGPWYDLWGKDPSAPQKA